VNPYLGSDTLEPFVRVAVEREAGIYVVVRSTNPGAGTFQDRVSDSLPLFCHVAAAVEKLAAETCQNTDFGVVGAVTAATNPGELAELRAALQHASLLVPGYGAQGATPRDVAAAFRPDGLGAVISSSRAINFAYRREPYASRYAPDEWEQAIEAATRQMIGEVAEQTAAGALL
jgi:orotidine-5'-phosphate decarboxylase